MADVDISTLGTEIKTAYEGEADTNAFTDAEKTKVAGLNGSPLTTKGDLYTYSTVDARLPVGTNDYVLTADSAEATGMKWSAASAGGGFTSIVDDETNGNYAIGLNALDSVTVGAGLDNIAIGGNAGTNITTGDRNVLIGDNAGGNMQSYASNNVFIGPNAGYANGNGENVAIGYSALQYAGNAERTVAIGYQAGYNLRTGADFNIVIGSAAGSNGTTLERSVAIGPVSFPSTTNDDQLVIGNGSHNAIEGYFGARSDVDYSGRNLQITGPSAFASASTNQDGGDLKLRPGQPASGGGSAGNIIITDLPTSDPTVAGALWNDSGTLKISAG